MFKKFLSLFTRWRPRDCGDVHAPWPDLVGQPRRVQAASDAPFETGTPHSRMHELIVSGKPDALIAIELGVEISAVRTYRHIISARARETARQRAAESRVPGMLTSGMLDHDIAAELKLELRVVRNIRDTMLDERRRATESRARRERVPAALLRRATTPAPADTIMPMAVGFGLGALLGDRPCPAPVQDSMSEGPGGSSSDD